MDTILFDEADEIYLSPQFLPYQSPEILLTHEFKEDIEYVDPETFITNQYSNRTFILNKNIDGGKVLSVLPREYNIIKDIEKNVKFFPSEINETWSRDGKLSIGFFQPVYKKLENKWKLKFNNISLLSEMTLAQGNLPKWQANPDVKKNKKKIAEEIKKLNFKSFFFGSQSIESRIINENKIFRDVYTWNPKYKPIGAYKKDDDGKLERINSNIKKDVLEKFHCYHYRQILNIMMRILNQLENITYILL